MIIGFGNNVVSSLAADITATQTTIQVMPGAGALFAAMLTYDYANDSNPLKTYAKITLTDAKETVFEVCHLTSVSNDMLTVVRGQEGTAKGWSLNDVIANFATRGSENQFIQIEQLQSGHYTSAVAGGTANGLTLALPATYFLNGSTDWVLRAPLVVYPIQNNTGASTLQLTMGGRVLGTYPLIKGSNTQLRSGDIVAKNPFLAVFNAEEERFVVLNPTTDVGSVRTVNLHAPDAAGNVKLGTAADADVGTASGNVMEVGAFGLGRGSNHKDDAYNNIGEIYRVNGSSANTPTTDVTGVISLPCDGGPSTAYAAVSNSGAAWVGSSSIQANGIKWKRVYTTAYKPTAADVDAYSKEESDERYLKLTGGALTGSTSAPLFTAQDGGVRINSEQDTTAQLIFSNAAGDVMKGRFYSESTDDGHRMVLHAGANASNEGSYWMFEPSGSVIIPNSVVWAAQGGSQGSIEAVNFGVGSRNSILQWNMATASTWGMYLDHDSTEGIGFGVNGTIKAEGEVQAGGEITWNHGDCRAYGDGNISGPIWDGYLRDWLLNNTISRVVRGAQGSMTMDGGLVEAPAGCVLTGGNGNEGNQGGVALYRPLQIWRSGYWQTIEG